MCQFTPSPLNPTVIRACAELGRVILYTLVQSVYSIPQTLRLQLRHQDTILNMDYSDTEYVVNTIIKFNVHAELGGIYHPTRLDSA